MALTLGAGQGGWGAAAKGGFVWNGPGPAPQMTDQEKLKSMGWMSSNPNGFDFGIKTPYNPSMLGGVSNQPVGQPAPGPGGLSSSGGSSQVPGPSNNWAGANTFDQYRQWAATQQPTAGAPAGQPGALPQIPTGNGGFTTTNPTTAAGVPKYGLIGSEEAMRGGLEGGIAGIEAGMNQAENTLSPYTGSGAKSSNLQAALSGALGPDAQRQAFATYNESPEVAYQREMGEKAIMRNAAATGGLGGSRVQQELQRHAIGLAQQDYGNAFNRLGSLSDRGLTSSNLLGGLQANAGGKVGDYAFGTGQAMASGRTRAGEQIANNVQGTSASLAEMLAKQGNDLSSVIGSGGGNIAQLLAQYGTMDADSQRALAALLANIASGSASTVAGASQLPGINDPGILGGIGQAAGGIGSAMSGWSAMRPTTTTASGGSSGSGGGSGGGGSQDYSAAIAATLPYIISAFSDIRLKKNIQKIGSLPSGTNLYSWEWNDIGAGLAGSQPTVGVIAQEVNQDAVIVGDHGYLMVDYSRVR